MTSRLSEANTKMKYPYLYMGIFKYGLGVEHDGVDTGKLLEEHQHDANA